MKWGEGREKRSGKNNANAGPEPVNSKFEVWAKTGNYGYYYYRGLYEGLESQLLMDKSRGVQEEIGQRIRSFLEHNNTDDLPPEGQLAVFGSNQRKMCSFVLQTVYPGLLIGAGYSHGISYKKDFESGFEDDSKAELESDFKLGFYFDYTTGLPVIPGSSVKGVLRSAFGAGHNKSEKYRRQKHEYIAEQLKKVGVEVATDDIEQLETAIFEGIVSGTQLPLAARDVFFDAWPIGGGRASGGRLFHDDYVTPHIKDGRNPDGGYFIEENSALKNPTPIRFLKVAPGVNYEFRFILTDTALGDIKVGAEIKLGLFKNILKDMGIGAKTRIGYGYFQEV